MRLCWMVAMSSLCLFWLGCHRSVQKDPVGQRIDTELTRSFGDISVENAIIAQHTLYPYHFTANGAELNELGQRDLAVLARYLAEHPGPLNVRRDNSPADLYEARVHFVLAKLKEAGVEADRINVSDDMPGGPGMPSERIVTILQSKQQISSTKTGGTLSTGKNE